MKIVKICDYDNQHGMAFEEAKEALKKKGLRFPSADESMQITGEEYNAFAPWWVEPLKTLTDLVLRGCDYYGGGYRRNVLCYGVPRLRFGVLGIVDEKPHKHKWQTKKVCKECGEEKK